MQVCCLKCRAHRDIANQEAVTLKTGRLATRGTCLKVCGKTVFRIGKP